MSDYDLKGEIIYFEIDLDQAAQLDSLKVSEFSIYPRVLRDITVVCDSSYVGSTIIKKIREKSHKHMINIRISDIFYSETNNSKNITLEIAFQAKDRTLVDKDVSGEMTNIVSTIENELKLKIKSQMTITKNTLVEMLHNEVGLNKREAKEFIELFFETLKKKFENGNDIKISGFGNFTLREKKMLGCAGTLKRVRKY